MSLSETVDDSGRPQVVMKLVVASNDLPCFSLDVLVSGEYPAPRPSSGYLSVRKRKMRRLANVERPNASMNLVQVVVSTKSQLGRHHRLDPSA